MAAGESDLVGLRDVWAAPDLDPDEAFLRDYILNKGYVDKEAMRWAVQSEDTHYHGPQWALRRSSLGWLGKYVYTVPCLNMIYTN